MPLETCSEKWVICERKGDGMEVVMPRRLTKCVTAGLWAELDSSSCHDDSDVFDTELEARNELEQRLYTRSENLRKHRQDMTRLLVVCAEKAHPSKRREGE